MLATRSLSRRPVRADCLLLDLFLTHCCVHWTESYPSFHQDATGCVGEFPATGILGMVQLVFTRSTLCSRSYPPNSLFASPPRSAVLGNLRVCLWTSVNGLVVSVAYKKCPPLCACFQLLYNTVRMRPGFATLRPLVEIACCCHSPPHLVLPLSTF